ncbi:hypothetical protein Tco_1067679 [Tanacetum coccineum]|uniref:Uncharacterized protein n=1 Tax=Tanacetum coccineum TaxID=301880 RepID=A0ABQ5EZK6_9ASTR
MSFFGTTQKRYNWFWRISLCFASGRCMEIEEDDWFDEGAYEFVRFWCLAIMDLDIIEQQQQFASGEIFDSVSRTVYASTAGESSAAG